MSSLGLGLVLAGVFLLLIAGRASRRFGLPAGRIISMDTSGMEPPGETMFDPELGLSGRPDFLLKKGRNLIPVELKSGSTPAAPYDSHVLQVGAYLALAWSQAGRRPPYGVLAYAGAAFQIPFTAGLERELRTTIARMRTLLGKPVDRSHASPERCAGCGYAEICDQSLSLPSVQRNLRL
jgi:CRISPR-associated exonuclease Cas4